MNKLGLVFGNTVACAGYRAHSQRTEQFLLYFQNIGTKCKQTIERLNFKSLAVAYLFVPTGTIFKKMSVGFFGEANLTHILFQTENDLGLKITMLNICTALYSLQNLSGVFSYTTAFSALGIRFVICTPH